MTSRREDEEEETGRKETSSSQGGRKEEEKEERGQTATTRVAKIVKIVGTSNKSWEDAAPVAIEEARKTIRGIRGIKIKDMTARVDPNTGRLVNTVHLSIFPLE